MNKITEKSSQILEAITALKKKAESKETSTVKEGVDLEGIVKKLSRNRSKKTTSAK